MKQQPNDPIAWMRLGEAYEKQGALPKSAEAYEQALKANPKLPSPLIKLAQLNTGLLQNSESALEFAMIVQAVIAVHRR